MALHPLRDEVIEDDFAGRGKGVSARVKESIGGHQGIGDDFRALGGIGGGDGGVGAEIDVRVGVSSMTSERGSRVQPDRARTEAELDLNGGGEVLPVSARREAALGASQSPGLVVGTVVKCHGVARGTCRG